MVRKRKSFNLVGKVFGDLVVIGETGKRGDGASWVLRNLKSGELTEASTSHLNSQSVTGYVGSERFIENTKKMSSDEESVLKRRITLLENSKGYSFDNSRKKYTAYIGIGGRKKLNLGRYDTEDEAKAARKKAVDEQIKILKKQLEKDDL